METALPRATIFNTETRKFSSTCRGIDYQISTWFPPGYPKAGYQYPVLYLLDAEITLGWIARVVLGFIWSGMMPDCLIVGVGHDVSTLDEWEEAREIDFTPAGYPGPVIPKRAADFLAFFKTELIPFVESTYPVSSTDRCLTGNSSGGKFALYALLHDPELFQRYFIGSVVWKNMLPHSLVYEQELAAQRKSLPVRVFFSMGELETEQLPDYYQFIDALQRRHYEGLHLETLVLAGETHGSVATFAYPEALRALYRPEKD